jgi:hypothetical protein
MFMIYLWVIAVVIADTFRNGIKDCTEKVPETALGIVIRTHHDVHPPKVALGG